VDALELSTPTQFGLNATPIQQIWVESKTLKCALFGQIRCLQLGQEALPERHKQTRKEVPLGPHFLSVSGGGI
jgi:hypothetical protein